MSRITGKEPEHWHDADGRHRMKDPREIVSIPKRYWLPDERIYAAHLAEHEGAIPQREDNDPEGIKALFDLIEQQQSMIKKAAMLITAIRQRNTESKGS